MKIAQVIGTAALFCMITSAGIASEVTTPDKLSFTKEMVSGKSMVSSGYPKGFITFNSDSTLTCNGYPSVVECKNWSIEADGTIVRNFIDKKSGTPASVRAVWKLTKNKGKSFDVEQTSNNSAVKSYVTVSYK